jgi:hypothetical protein
VIYAIQMGLGDGVEWVGGIWLLTTSWILLKTQKQPLLLHTFGLGIGITGCLTLIPALAQIGAIFGLAQIMWFVWVAKTMFQLSREPNSVE